MDVGILEVAATVIVVLVVVAVMLIVRKKSRPSHPPQDAGTYAAHDRLAAQAAAQRDAAKGVAGQQGRSNNQLF